MKPHSYLLSGRRAGHPDLKRPWKVWDLDSELRYLPVIEVLPDSGLPICEVGSGPQGLARWTPREIVGVDPGDDERHTGLAAVAPPNLQRLTGDGSHIPLEDGAAAATLAVDTLEHIPRSERQAVFVEMMRVTAPGGRVIIMGPAGPDAAQADVEMLERYKQAGIAGGPIVWLTEHVEFGLPTVDEIVEGLSGARTRAVAVRGIYNLSMWRVMHRAALGEFPQPRGFHLVHHLAWAPFGILARRWRRGPFYRYLVVADLE